MDRPAQLSPSAARAAVPARRRSRGRPWWTIAMFLTPALLLYLGFIIYPVFATVFNSFHILRMDLGMMQEFVGLQHYQELLSVDEVFRKAVQHSLIWAVVSPAIELTLGFFLAFFLYTRMPGWRVFRVAWFAPMLLAGVVVAVLWKWIFNYDWGTINVVLRTIGLSGIATDWLGNPDLAFPALILVTTWMFTGFNMVIMLASMASIPAELIEAVQVDGANTRQVIRYVMLPLMQPTFANLAILSFIGKMKQFEIVWLITRGGPMWGTETVATYVFKRAFEWRTLDLGYPSAIAVLWFVVILALTLVLTRVLQRRDILEY